MSNAHPTWAVASLRPSLVKNAVNDEVWWVEKDVSQNLSIILAALAA